MKPHFLKSAALSVALILFITGCAGQAAPPVTPPVDSMGTTVAQLVSAAITGTASASSATPPVTPTPKTTSTPTLTITPTGVPRPPLVVNFAGCWRGPGSNYVLVSNISKGQRVDLKGIGSVPGWYIIINPYFRQLCWIQAQNLSIHAGTDMTKYPVMTPGTPGP
ncbi:MAG TPA: hypothetical protein VIN60_08150 [Anaerolineales bacterium]